jgi:hypothetical protein
MALALANVEFCDVRTVCGWSTDDIPSNKRECFKAKSRPGEEKIFDFPNLSHYLDQDV